MATSGHTIEKARALQLVRAFDVAGATRVSVEGLHTVAYLADALSPVWGASLEASALIKRSGVPFLARLQNVLDELVVEGLLGVSDFSYVQLPEVGWRIRARYSIIRARSRSVFEVLDLFEDEVKIAELYLELALALGTDEELSELIGGDAVYSDSRVSAGRLLELSPAVGENVSANVANYFSEVMPDKRPATAGEKINLYVRLLQQRAASRER